VSERLLLSPKEAARMLAVGRNQLYEWVHDGTLPSLRVGRRILIPVVALERFAEHVAENGKRP
jgi:excisionase family DNA binding protein